MQNQDRVGQDNSPIIYVCRHGDTAWSAERRFAGRTDIPLTSEGEAAAGLLGARLKPIDFARVFVSPMSRARDTAARAGFGDRAEIDARLNEIAFGKNEGKTQAEIARELPGWTYIRNGNPEGETIDDVGARVDSFLAEVTAVQGRVLIFAHSVVLRVMGARWIGEPAIFSQHLALGPASLSVLTWDKIDLARSLACWNDRAHLGEIRLP